MRIRVRHATTYYYDEPAYGVIQALRVSPSDHDGQQVLNWRVDVNVDGFLRESRDAFGNILHLFYAEGDNQEAAHAWAEAYVPDLGWTGFDPANGVCADHSYLRVAVGLDYLDAAPLRGARRGGGEERLSVSVVAREARRQRQD